MKRRAFIGIAAVGAAGVIVPTPARGRAAATSALHHPRLLAIVRDEEHVAELGRCYLELTPSENTGPVLTRLIEEDVRGLCGESSPDIGADAQQARVDRQVQADFAQGRTVMLQGWVLSRTEARQCALFSLRQT